jgi:hypothetical protein
MFDGLGRHECDSTLIMVTRLWLKEAQSAIFRSQAGIDSRYACGRIAREIGRQALVDRGFGSKACTPVK